MLTTILKRWLGESEKRTNLHTAEKIWAMKWGLVFTCGYPKDLGQTAKDLFAATPTSLLEGKQRVD